MELNYTPEVNKLLEVFTNEVTSNYESITETFYSAYGMEDWFAHYTTSKNFLNLSHKDRKVMIHSYSSLLAFLWKVDSFVSKLETQQQKQRKIQEDKVQLIEH